MNCAAIDTNILLYIYLNKVDVFELLEEKGFSRLLIPKMVWEELKKLQNKLSGEEKIAAGFALELVEDRCEVVDIHAENTDDSLVNLAQEYGCILVSSDKELINKAKTKKVETAYLREMKKIEFNSGY
ncbi:MAG: PIN domain-containing protein [Archaeoglobaceae archaeon]